MILLIHFLKLLAWWTSSARWTPPNKNPATRPGNHSFVRSFITLLETNSLPYQPAVLSRWFSYGRICYRPRVMNGPFILFTSSGMPFFWHRLCFWWVLGGASVFRPPKKCRKKALLFPHSTRGGGGSKFGSHCPTLRKPSWCLTSPWSFLWKSTRAAILGPPSGRLSIWSSGIFSTKKFRGFETFWRRKRVV